MQYRTLGRTNLSISAVSLGAWEIGGARVPFRPFNEPFGCGFYGYKGPGVG